MSESFREQNNKYKWRQLILLDPNVEQWQYPTDGDPAKLEALLAAAAAAAATAANPGLTAGFIQDP